MSKVNESFVGRRAQQLLAGGEVGDDPEFLIDIAVAGKRMGGKVLWSVAIDGTVDGEPVSKAQADHVLASINEFWRNG